MSQTKLFPCPFCALTPQRDAAEEMYRALKEIIGTAPEYIDAQIGWCGHRPVTNEHFQCEFCGECDLDMTKIPHLQTCKLLTYRAAIAKWEETR